MPFFDTWQKVKFDWILIGRLVANNDVLASLEKLVSTSIAFIALGFYVKIARLGSIKNDDGHYIE